MKEVHAVTVSTVPHVVGREKCAAMVQTEVRAAKLIPNSAASAWGVIRGHAVRSLGFVVVLNAAMQAKPVVATTTQMCGAAEVGDLRFVDQATISARIQRGKWFTSSVILGGVVSLMAWALEPFLLTQPNMSFLLTSIGGLKGKAAHPKLIRA